jgi:hypothetical protein
MEKKLEISSKRKYSNTWRLSNTLSNNQWSTKEIKKEINIS